MLARMIGSGILHPPVGGDSATNTAVVLYVNDVGSGFYEFVFDKDCSPGWFATNAEAIEMTGDSGCNPTWVPALEAADNEPSVMVLMSDFASGKLEWRIIADPGLEFSGGATAAFPQSGFVTV